MGSDQTLLTKRYLTDVITCIENCGYDVEDFEFSTQRIKGYKRGYLNPKAIVYARRLSTGIEKSYILGGDPDFSMEFCDDLQAGLFDKIF